MSNPSKKRARTADAPQNQQSGTFNDVFVPLTAKLDAMAADIAALKQDKVALTQELVGLKRRISHLETNESDIQEDLTEAYTMSAEALTKCMNAETQQMTASTGLLAAACLSVLTTLTEGGLSGMSQATAGKMSPVIDCINDLKHALTHMKSIKTPIIKQQSIDRSDNKGSTSTSTSSTQSQDTSQSD